MELDKETIENLREFLDKEAIRINHPDFIANDPVQFPRRFEVLQDIEIGIVAVSIDSMGKP